MRQFAQEDKCSFGSGVGLAGVLSQGLYLGATFTEVGAKEEFT